MTQESSVPVMLAEARALHQQGQLGVAGTLYQKILQREPAHAEALMLLGVLAYQHGNFPAAEGLLQRAISIDGGNAAAWCNYGNALQELQRLDEAKAAFKNAIRIQPEFPEAFVNLGNVYAMVGLLEQAVACHEKALQLRPGLLDARLNLGISLREMGEYEKAEQCFTQAMSMHPQSAEAVHNLGSLYAEWGRIEEAFGLFERAIALRPDYAEAHSNLGALYLEAGQHEKAMEYFGKAPSFSPQYHIAESNRIFAMHYDPHVSSEALFEAAVKWGQAHAPASLMHPPELNKNPERRLRVGYVSADIRAHPVGIFLESVLANHSDNVEVFCYANMPHEDHQTRRIKPLVAHWRRIFGKADSEVERIIREDKIDILLDMSGHTAGNRLKVFAAKPAGVQMSWIGYFDTTGMPAMDYIICDEQVLPKASERWFTEKPLRMPVSYLCFTPPSLAIVPVCAPFETNGYVTFGCFNRLNKMTPEVLGSWAEILRDVPGSRLLLKSKAFGQEDACGSVRESLRAGGIEGERVLFEGASPRADYLAAYNKVDIVLDPFPYGGGTTTAEALWMGRPVITWPQERFISRLSASFLSAMGRREWIADSRQEYIVKAAGLAKNPGALRAAHLNTSQDFCNSPACDAKSFVYDLENLYRAAWRKFCEK